MLKLLAIAALALVTLVGAETVGSRECLAGRRDALTAGNFSGPIVCSDEDATFNLAGTTSSGYAIYDYRYRFPAGVVMHGGQRIVIFLGSEYVGQYGLSPPPYQNLSVEGSRVIVKANEPGFEDAVLDFVDGPPSRIFAAGFASDLFR